MKYINENSSNPNLCIREISENISLSYNYFCTMFRKYTFYSPYDYISHIRIQKAQSLLFTKNLTIKEVAIACGFNDNTRFIATFKRITGTTPKQWLMKIKNQPGKIDLKFIRKPNPGKFKKTSKDETSKAIAANK